MIDSMCVGDFSILSQVVNASSETVIIPKSNYHVHCELGIGNASHPDVLVNSPTSAKAYSKKSRMAKHYRCLHSMNSNQKSYIQKNT